MMMKNDFEAYLDELESELKGSDVYVTPPCSTQIAPEQPSDGHTLVFENDKWVEVEDNRGLIVYNSKREEMVVSELGPIPKGWSTEKPYSLKELKEQKLTELKSHYKEACEQRVKIGKIKANLEDSVYLSSLLNIYNKDYNKVSCELGDELVIVSREEIEKAVKHLYLRHMLLAQRRINQVKELNGLKGKQQVLDFVIDFDVDKEIKDMMPLSIEEINSKF